MLDKKRDVLYIVSISHFKGGQVMVTVYTKPNCMQCKFTKKFLQDKEISFETVDVTESEEALYKVKSLGFQALPVIVADGQEPFYGFRPEMLQALA